MSTELATRKGAEIEEAKKCILMKSGLAFWVKMETAAKLEAITTAPNFQHQFVNIAEVGQTLNTAQIEGIYSRDTYTEIQRIKEGERKCAWGNWHKRKEECQCQAEARKKAREAEEKRRKDAEYRPLTPEEQADARARWKWLNEEAALKGPGMWRDMFRVGNKSGRRMSWEGVKRFEKEHKRKPDLTGIWMEDTAEEIAERARQDELKRNPPPKPVERVVAKIEKTKAPQPAEDFEREARESGII